MLEQLIIYQGGSGGDWYLFLTREKREKKCSMEFSSENDFSLDKDPKVGCCSSTGVLVAGRRRSKVSWEGGFLEA